MLIKLQEEDAFCNNIIHQIEKGNINPFAHDYCAPH